MQELYSDLTNKKSVGGFLAKQRNILFLIFGIN